MSTSPAVTAVFPPDQAQAMVDTLRKPPGMFGLGRSRWRLLDLSRVLPFLAGYTLAGICGALARLKVGRKRGRLSIHSPDLAYGTKLAWVESALALAREHPDRVSLLYGDEFSLYRQPSLASVYAPSGEEPTARLSLRGNTRYRLGAALDALTGRVSWVAGDRVGVDKLGELLGQLRANYPTRQLFLVWDNWPVHRHPQVLLRATELEIEILWLPTYAPWTNPIEKLWRMLKADLLHHHRLADQWEELRGQVTHFLDQFQYGSPGLLRYVGLLSD